MRRAALVVALLLIALMAAVVPAAAQVPNVVEPPPEAGGVQKQVGQSEVGNSVERNAPAEVKAAQPPLRPSDDDSTGHETANPGQPEHARGEAADSRLQGDNLATVSHSNSQVEDSNRARGDAVVLVLLGSEVLGAHSDSRGGDRSERTGGDLCGEGAPQGICLEILFAGTRSSETRTQSSSISDVTVTFACVGGQGDISNPSACRRSGALLGTSVATSHSDIHEDRTDGRTRANQEAHLTDVCLAATPTGFCTVGTRVLHSESHSDTNTGTRRRSFLASLELGGQETVLVEDPQDLSLGLCPATLCLFVNQGETRVFTGGHSGRQEALHLDVLGAPTVDLLLAHLGDAETLVERDNILDRRVCPPVCPPGERVLGERGPTAAGAGAGAGALPFTGWNLILPLGLAIGFVLMGAGLIRRR